MQHTVQYISKGCSTSQYAKYSIPKYTSGHILQHACRYVSKRVKVQDARFRESNMSRLKTCTVFCKIGMQYEPKVKTKKHKIWNRANYAKVNRGTGGPYSSRTSTAHWRRTSRANWLDEGKTTRVGVGGGTSHLEVEREVERLWLQRPRGHRHNDHFVGGLR